MFMATSGNEAKHLNNMAELTLLSLIEEQKARIKTIQYINDPILPYYCYPDVNEYEIWLAKTRRFLGTQFPNDKDLKEFEKISKQRLSKKQQLQLLAILEAYNSIPSIIPETDEANTSNTDNQAMLININNTNSQSQNQEQSLTIGIFLEAIKDDLTGRQVKELKQIVVDNDNDLEKAKPSIIEKLKSFGSNVAASIVANLITNPSIWNCL